MSSLDSPLEVLALDYLGFGLFTAVVNNVWTWIAVVTAAVSVWRIRTISSSSSSFVSHEVSVVKPAASLASSPVKAVPVEPAKVEAPAAPPASAPPSPSPFVFTGEGRTSGKFTLYYDNQEECEEQEEADTNDDDGDVDGECKLEEVRNNWEVMMEMRINGVRMGFYRYQDLTVLNGNVVRLWDGCRRRNLVNAAPLIRFGGGNWQSLVG
ncbi:OLC1v1037961C1 [Oldenlandia corymbosa var. corymbosa]|uniref:OLC1v1037961C1 n=1 Tax=Oldenlandia corymbosa var. corymbosa TaxID=529605 RepID=A0AAV1CZW4_OLDCO|nr:OLC1v1037961C1 [Oldenlandia corymbosa var. corymbosa]